MGVSWLYILLNSLSHLPASNMRTPSPLQDLCICFLLCLEGSSHRYLHHLPTSFKFWLKYLLVNEAAFTTLIKITSVLPITLYVSSWSLDTLLKTLAIELYWRLSEIYAKDLHTFLYILNVSFPMASSSTWSQHYFLLPFSRHFDLQCNQKNLLLLIASWCISFFVSLYNTPLPLSGMFFPSQIRLSPTSK